MKAVTVYLLASYAWALAYQLVALSDPMASNFPAGALQPQNLRFRLLYFSTTTLTVGYGDITPLSSVARSLAALEGMIGQLFPVLLLARLVLMELQSRQRTPVIDHLGHNLPQPAQGRPGSDGIQSRAR